MRGFSKKELAIYREVFSKEMKDFEDAWAGLMRRDFNRYQDKFSNFLLKLRKKWAEMGITLKEWRKKKEDEGARWKKESDERGIENANNESPEYLAKQRAAKLERMLDSPWVDGIWKYDGMTVLEVKYATDIYVKKFPSTTEQKLHDFMIGLELPFSGAYYEFRLIQLMNSNPAINADRKKRKLKSTGRVDQNAAQKAYKKSMGSLKKLPIWVWISMAVVSLAVVVLFSVGRSK